MPDAAKTAISLIDGLEKDEFVRDRILVDAATENLGVIGEAATRSPTRRRRRSPKLPLAA